jgi:hypothetical protein
MDFFMRNSLFIFMLLVIYPSLFAQYEDLPPIHENEFGAGITLAMSGFGLGGFYRFGLPSYFHIGVAGDFYVMRDENEFTGYDIYGYPVQVNKFNRLFLIPISVELKKRLFQESIEEGFRPHMTVAGGVTFGMNYPRNNSYEFSLLPLEEQERLPRENEFRYTFNFAIGIGADITTNETLFISIRPQYRFIYFPESIAGNKNHSNFEIRVELGKRNHKKS